ncbi:MAG: helix-turn-helix transcriptional regulator [Pseudomonadota bacterium]
MLGISNAELANRASISVNTLTRAEQGLCRASTLQKLEAVLETAGIEFIPENGGGAGVRRKGKAQ